MAQKIDFAKLSLKDALDLAIFIEEEAKERYEQFSKLVGGRYKGDADEVFKNMAGYEARHGAELSARRKKLFGGAPSSVTSDMVEDVEAVRQALGLGPINLLGHSYGGVLAQAYALKYQRNLRHLVLCSTFHSTKAMNAVFAEMKARMAPELRERIEKLEAAGLFGKGRIYERNRYPEDYMIAAWGEGYFPYLYGRRPDPNHDPHAVGNMSWDLYREMWGSHGEFVIDGNLVSVEYADRLPTLRVPTLITVGDHDQCDPSLARAMHERIAGSELVVFPDAGHMTFVDQTALFIRSVDGFLHAPEKRAAPGGKQ